MSRFLLVAGFLFAGMPFARAELCGSNPIAHLISPTNTRNVVAIASIPVSSLEQLNDCRLALGARSNDLLACIHRFYSDFRTDAISSARADIQAHLCAQNVAQGSASLQKAAHAFSAQILANKIQGDLLGIQGKLAMGENLTAADLAYLKKVEKITGIGEIIGEARKMDPAAAQGVAFDMIREMEAKAEPLRPHFTVLKRAGVKAGAEGISFQGFDFASRLRQESSAESQALKAIYGPEIFRQLKDTFLSPDPRKGRRAIVLGDSVVMPNRDRADRSPAQSKPAIVTRSEYEKLLAAAGKNFESRTLEYLALAAKYDTHWEATKRFVPEYAKQLTMLASDPATAKWIDRAWQPQTQVEKQLGPSANAMTQSLSEMQLKYGMDPQATAGQLNLTLLALSEGRIRSDDAYRKVKHIAKGFGGAYATAAVVATGGYLAYTFPSVGTFLLGAAAVENLAATQISTAAMMSMTKMAGFGLGFFAVDGVLTAAVKGSYGGGGFWCHIGEELMASQTSALQFSAFAAVFPGASQAIKKLMILDKIPPRFASRLAPFLTAGIIGTSSIVHASHSSQDAQEDFADARELEERGDQAGAQRKRHDGWVHTKNVLFPLVSIAAAPLAGGRELGPRPAPRVEPSLRPPPAAVPVRTPRVDGPDVRTEAQPAGANGPISATPTRTTNAGEAGSIPVIVAQTLLSSGPKLLTSPPQPKLLAAPKAAAPAPVPAPAPAHPNASWKSRLDEVWERPELKEGPMPEAIESTYPESQLLYKIKAKHGRLKPSGTHLDSPEVFKKMPDGEKFPFLLLPGEKALRYDPTVTGGHAKLADDQPIRTGGQILKESVPARGPDPAKVRVTFDNQSGHYHPPLSTLRRAVEALWEAGIYPDEILIKSWDSKGSVHTIRLDSAGKLQLEPVPQ